MKRGFSAILFLSAVITFICFAGEAQDLDKRKSDLEEMLALFPKSEPWEQWLEKSGELPPDFDALPSRPYLPD